MPGNWHVNKPEYVLDSYALLAYLQGERGCAASPGADQVEELLDQAAEGRISIRASLINLGEVAYLVERRHGLAWRDRVLDELASFPIAFGEVTMERILAAAHVKAHHAISYADAFAAALAQEFDATLVTGDPEFRQVEPLVRVLWL